MGDLLPWEQEWKGEDKTPTRTQGIHSRLDQCGAIRRTPAAGNAVGYRSHRRSHFLVRAAAGY